MKELTNEEKLDIIQKITEMCSEIGWSLALPNEDLIDGIVIGTEDFLGSILGGTDEFEVWESTGNDGSSVH